MMHIGRSRDDGMSRKRIPEDWTPDLINYSKLRQLKLARQKRVAKSRKANKAASVQRRKTRKT